MKKRRRIIGIVFGIIAVLVIAGVVNYKSKYPYGWSHCCIIQVMMALKQYAEENGRYPTGESSPEASLSLVCRSDYINAYIIRGMTVPEATVRKILEAGDLLGPDTCGWHYTEGLTDADNPRIALLYCKQPLGHNGKRTKDGGRQVVFIGGNIEWISGEKWPSFLQEQKELLAKRDDRAKSGTPLVNAIIELPDGQQIQGVEGMMTIEQQETGQDGSSGHGTSSGTSSRDSLVWFNTPLQNNYSGFITRTLSFSNLVSAPVTLTFTNGVPDKTNVVFRMRTRAP